MKPNSVEIVAVVDRSGSMESIKKDMEGGWNNLIADQRKLPGQCLVTLTQFNSEAKVVYAGRPIADVPKFNLRPMGGTALNDAVAQAIALTGGRLAAMPEAQRPSKVMFIIITDGEENSSVEYGGPAGTARVKAMIEHQRDVYNWEFVYLGSELNTEKAAFAVGLGAQNTVMYANTAIGTRSLYQAASSAIRATRLGGPGGQSISFNADAIRSHMPQGEDDANGG